MKHALKIILPIILILALIIGACCFFLIVRRDLTESIFVYWGEHFYEAGRYSRAVAFYKAAMHFAPKDADLAICLADAYKKSGNYTKAEYTLVSAITQIPDSVQLYVALSKTYVEQDKLLDAETMLGRITNDAVRTQIDALRPAAPVIEPESGNYSEYIDVTVTGASGTVYAVCNSDFPASEQDVYTGPISLEAGESKIVALSVAENGLVSDAVYAGYTVGNVVEEVKLADAGMDAYVRELLGKTAGSAIMSDELWAVEELDLPDTVASLEDLPYFTGLHSLSLHHGTGLDLSVLSQLPTLRKLDLSGCTLSTAAMNTIVTLSELTSLNLSGCAVAEIDALIGLQKLETLDLSNNTVSDLTALSALLALRELNLTNNPITSLSNLKNCTELETLYAGQCAITRIAGLADHTKLKTLVLSGNKITDISALAGCTAIETLDLSGNSISDISVVSGFKKLVDLNVSSNQITDLPQFDADTPLWHVDISHNQIESLAGLEGNLAVNFINADYNRVKSVAKLESCIMLVRMNLWDNPVDADEVKQLQDIGILINYNPNYVEPETES
jgi:hypothetical protein